MTRRGGGAKPDVHRGVSVHNDTWILAANAGELLIRATRRLSSGVCKIEGSRKVDPKLTCWLSDFLRIRTDRCVLILNALAKRMPQTAHRAGAAVEDVSIDTIVVGDELLIYIGFFHCTLPLRAAYNPFCR
jgi:hypothetical protein